MAKRAALFGNDDGQIVIEYGTIRLDDGWIPQVWLNGHTRMDSWSKNVYDHDLALRAAEHEAKRQAERYIGDWTITITKHASAAPPRRA